MRLHATALIFLLGTVSCAKHAANGDSVLYRRGLSSQDVSVLSYQVGVASGKGDEFVAEDVVFRVVDQANWSGRGGRQVVI